MAGIGAVIRYSCGNFIAGLAANIGSNTNITAEIWAGREGLRLAQRKQIQCIHVETDSYTTFLMLSRNKADEQVDQILLRDIQALVLEFEVV